ncbi:CehA/McbA family metallohydrolase [Vallitalea okinawensis]|uniref:CehA/McbA family metallohydrolase n=1 Tax=Vallitalea okinawensis TaxID=2078660 RepID=UPI000CFD9FF1|nr:CehA/McbA family metallohydrolase [Vallitalea okinawensis]
MTKKSVLKIVKQIDKTFEKQYIEVPFQVRDVEKIEVTMHVDGDGSCIDLGIKDEEGVRGWSGGARDGFCITKSFATPGYQKGPIKNADWAILLGAYKVPEEGCHVSLSIDLYHHHHRWLKGDFHSHSVHSDGKYMLSEVENIAADNGLDFIATTDHNAVTQNSYELQSDKVIFIPGMELTTNYGHCNFLGITKSIKDFRCHQSEDVKKVIKEAMAMGAVVSLNHPMDELCGWHFGFDVPHDLVELWNGPFSACGNAKTLKWWHEQLKAGKQLPIIGGSDVHRPHPYIQHGKPTTNVWCYEKSIEAILDAIKKGHVFMSYSPSGPTIELQSDEKMMGDTITDTEEILIKCDGLATNDQVQVISDQQIECSHIVKDEKEFEEGFKGIGLQFLRVEVWRYFEEVGDYLLAAVSNPIYIR